MACERICFGLQSVSFFFLLKFFQLLIFFFNLTFIHLINLSKKHFKKQLKKVILDVNKYHFKIKILLMYVFPHLTRKSKFFRDFFFEAEQILSFLIN
jgi:hypothetical protein